MAALILLNSYNQGILFPKVVIHIFFAGLFLAGWATNGISAPFDPERPQVWKVEIEGNEFFSDVLLKDQIATEVPPFFTKLIYGSREEYTLNETTIRKDNIRLQNYYKRRGFINVNVEYEIKDGDEPWKKEVYFYIDENAPVHIEKLEYQIDSEGLGEQEVHSKNKFEKVKRNHAFQEGNRYESIREPEVIGNFTDVLKNIGFAHASVSIETEIDSTNLSADVTIYCKAGPLTKIGEIEIRDNDRLSDEYILRQASLEVGERYSLEKLQNAQQQLFDHHLIRFATISIPEEQPKDSTLSLVLRVRERESRSVEVLAGFGTEEKFRGQVSWRHRNAFGSAHRFTSTGRASFIEQSLSLDYLFPYIFNTKSSIVLSPFVQHLLESNFELFRTGITNSFIYQYSKTLTASASYEYTKNRELSQQFAQNMPDSTQKYDLSSLQFSSYYTQGYGRQQEGWVIQPYAELFGFMGLTSLNFQKISLDVRKFTRLSSSTMLATRVQGGRLFNVSTDSLPQNIRYYIGGTNSVRGWQRRQMGPKRAEVDSSGFQRYVPSGGRAMFGFNLEIRQELNALIDGFGVAVFFDGGQIWDSNVDRGIRPIQFGTGGGLRYQSPIGPVRLDVGYKINPTQQDLNVYRGRNFGNSWDRIGIHVSIGQAF